MKTTKTIIAAVVALLAGSVASSRGQQLDLSSGATLEGDLTNQVLVNSGTSANDGVISSWVVSDANVDSKGYIFIYQMENAGPDEITGVNFNNFTSADVIGTGVYSNIVVGGSFSMPGVASPTTLPFPAPFAFDTVTGGGAATFNAQGTHGGLNMGAESWFFAIDTDVNSFQTGYALTQDDFQAHGDTLAENFAVFSVPEPSSVILLTGGIVCLYLILRCRRAMS